MTEQGLRARILIVDDEPLNLDVLEQELGDRDYEVESASNGADALRMVAASAPDLILLDVVMPGLDGIEVCRQLKDDIETAHIPIIIMTALSAVEDRIRGIEAGADDFLSKPVDDRELMARINTALRGKRAVDQTRKQLSGATDRLRVLGTIDRDISVVVASGVPLDRGTLLAAGHQATVGFMELADGSEAIVITTTDPLTHSLAALELAEHAARHGARVSVESGSGLVSARADVGPAEPGWLGSVEGPAFEAAQALVELAPPGQVVLGPEVSSRLESRIVTSALIDTDAQRLERGPRASDGGAGQTLILAWPDDYADILEPLRSDWGVQGPIYLTRSLSGKSGARVYAVDITCRAFSGQAILKLDRSRDPAWDENAEAERHRRAFEAGRDFAENHLPRVVASFVQGDRAAVLSTIAGRGLEFVVPWAQDTHERQRSSARTISADILARWNADHRLSPVIPPGDLFASWLGFRMDRSRSRITPFLAAAGLDADEPSFSFDGRWYPNPYAFARGVVPLPNRLALRAAMGRIHGDFHGFNILLRTDADQTSYFIIDLAYYADETYLFFDNAYLELAYMLQTRETAQPGRWLQLVTASQGQGAPIGDDLGLYQLIDSIRSGARDWIDEREPNRLGYMESQYALARVAVGLNFVNKRVSDRTKLLALLYAASNLKAYLRLHDLDWPRSGPTLDLG